MANVAYQYVRQNRLETSSVLGSENCPLNDLSQTTHVVLSPPPQNVGSSSLQWTLVVEPLERLWS